MSTLREDFTNKYNQLKSGLSEGLGILWDETKAIAGRGARAVLNWAGDGVKKVVSGVNEVAPNMLPTATATLAELSFRGSQGSFAGITRDIVLVEKFMPLSGSSPSKFGYPACKSRPIENLSGFCMTQNAMFEINGTIEEEQALEELFNKGVILDWSGMTGPF